MILGIIIYILSILFWFIILTNREVNSYEKNGKIKLYKLEKIKIILLLLFSNFLIELSKIELREDKLIFLFNRIKEIHHQKEPKQEEKYSYLEEYITVAMPSIDASNIKISNKVKGIDYLEKNYSELKNFSLSTENREVKYSKIELNDSYTGGYCLL